MPDLLSERGRALEDKFFAERERQLLDALRAKTEREAVSAELAHQTGIADQGLVQRLVGLGLSPDTLAAFNVVPMLMVAWGDDLMDAAEREAILEEAVASGISRESSAFTLLSGWLTRAPNPELVDAWRAFHSHLDGHLSEEERRALREDLLGRAERIARVSGGFLGIGAVSADERRTLDDLKATLGG